jgi:DNA polymerase type B, organellar and viral
MTKASKQIYLDYNVNIMDNLTISGLAVRIFLKDFYQHNIPCINKISMYRDIKKGYYGGITEVYKPYGENLYYYDVNSLYPFVALQDMPGLTCSKVYYKHGVDFSSLGNVFGFFHCSIITPKDDYLGILPVRTANGIHFPLGKWTG